MVSFLLFSVIVCARLMTRKLRGQPASVGLAQAHFNYGYLVLNLPCLRIISGTPSLL